MTFHTSSVPLFQNTALLNVYFRLLFFNVSQNTTKDEYTKTTLFVTLDVKYLVIDRHIFAMEKIFSEIELSYFRYQ